MECDPIIEVQLYTVAMQLVYDPFWKFYFVSFYNFPRWSIRKHSEKKIKLGLHFFFPFLFFFLKKKKLLKHFQKLPKEFVPLWIPFNSKPLLLAKLWCYVFLTLSMSETRYTIYPKNRKVNLELQNFRGKSLLFVASTTSEFFNKVFSKQKSSFSTFFQKWQSVWKSQSL